MLGVNACRFALVFYLTMKEFNLIYCRHFIQSSEVVLNLIILWYFLHLGEGNSTQIFTGLIAGGFMIRNTVLLPWIPLIVV